MSIIIGIDPGSRMTGYGVIQQTGDSIRFIDSGTIHTEGKEMPERLKQIFLGITRIIEHYRRYSDVSIFGAIEQVFMAQNPDSALKLGQARGAAIAALVAKDIEVSEYTARQIKQAVCGYGAADKQQVQQMVSRLLTLDVVPASDAADGLACAICHAHSIQSVNKLLTPNVNQPRGRATGRRQGRWRLTDEDIANLQQRSSASKK